MRVCHVVYGYFPADPRVRREVDTLAEMGHELDVIALQDEGEPVEDRAGRVRVRRVPLRIRRGRRLRYAFQYTLFLLAAGAMLSRVHLRRRFDVVHVHSLPDFLVFVAFLPKLTGARVILDLHEAMPEITMARFRLGARSPLVVAGTILERASCAFADRVIVVTETIRELLQSRGVPPRKLTVVMNASDVDASRPPPHELALTLGASGKRVIVYTGGINPERDLELLIRAVSAVRHHHDVVLLLFGPGDEAYKTRLKELAAREGLGDSFRLGPWVRREDVPSLLALSEIGPVTYESNPLTHLAIPNKVFEYAAAGKPLVVADLRTLHSLLGDAALYYRPGDSEDLARRIDELLQDAPQRERLATAAREILSRHSWKVMTGRLRELYETLAPVRG